MTIAAFPPVELADEDGLLAVGGDLEPDSLLLAYSSGIFPWPLDSRTLAWFAPPKRAVLFFDELHVATRLARLIKQGRFECAINRNLPLVIERCSEVINRGRQRGTWITPAMRRAYCKLGELGFCHSYESYLDGELVGGLYTIQIDRFVGGESMFFRVPNASKVAFAFMIQHLQEAGFEWLDCQVLTPLSISFAAREIQRDEFMLLLEKSLRDIGNNSVR